MLDQLVQLVKNYAGEAIVSNPAVPNDQNDAMINEASQSISNGLQTALANGQTQDVLGLLKGQTGTDTSNPLVNNISGNFISNIMQKFNISPEIASSIAGSIIPSVMGGLVNKTNDPSDNSFSLPGILSSLTGGGNSNLSGMLDKLGLDRDGDGDVDLQDLTSMLSKGAQQQQSQQGGGGLGDLLGGFFGK